MIKDKAKLKAGALLISPPMQSDINFRRAVVLLCEHSDTGSFGLILNRSLALVMEQVFDDLPGFGEEIGCGGPVQPETLHFIHRLPEQIIGGIEVQESVYWGGDFEQVKKGIQLGSIDPNDIRFFLGYTGWTSGQLAEEVEQGGWILATADEDTVFDTAESTVWRQTLKQLGGSYAILANYPEHPSLN
jgi:putative transcriptional regulator